MLQKQIALSEIMSAIRKTGEGGEEIQLSIQQQDLPPGQVERPEVWKPQSMEIEVHK